MKLLRTGISSMPSKIQTLIVDAVRSDRLRLKEVLYATGKFDAVEIYDNLKNSLEYFTRSKTNSCDIIFVSSSFSFESIARWLSLVKDTVVGEDSAFIFVLSTIHQQRTLAAIDVLVGVDGFLLEPYGVEALEGVVELASQVKKHRRAARKAALELLVDDSMVHLDQMAADQLQGREPSERLQYFRTLGKVLFRLNETNLDSYYEVALSKLPELRSPKAVLSEQPNSAITEQLKRSLTADQVEEYYLGEAVARVKKRLVDDGINVSFLDEAVERIRKRLGSQGILVDFIDGNEERAEAVIERKRQAAVNELRERLTAKGIHLPVFEKAPAKH